MGRKKKDTQKDNVNVNKKEVTSKTKQPPLYTFEMCKKCVKKCKMAGIKGAILEYCPDFKEKEE